MEDQRLRELERKAGLGEISREQLIHAHIRSRSPTLIKAESLQKNIKSQIQKLSKNMDSWSGRRANTQLIDFLPTLTLILKSEKDLDTAWASLKKSQYNVSYNDEYRSFDLVSILGLVVKDGAEYTLSFAVTHSKNPSPGTTWNEFKPWRAKISDKALRQRLHKFQNTTQKTACWISIPKLVLEVLYILEKGTDYYLDESLAPKENPATQKQLRYVLSLLNELKLEKGQLTKLYKKQKVPDNLAKFTKKHAGTFIDGLLEAKEIKTQIIPKATKAQLSFLKKLKRRNNLKAAEWQAILHKHCEVQGFSTLSKRQVSKLLDLLQNTVELEKALQVARKEVANLPTTRHKKSSVKKKIGARN